MVFFFLFSLMIPILALIAACTAPAPTGELSVSLSAVGTTKPVRSRMENQGATVKMAIPWLERNAP